MEQWKLYAFADEAGPMMEQQIAALKRNGLNGVEIRNVDGVNVSDISTEKAKEVRRKLLENGLVTWSVGSPIGKIHLETDDFRAHIEKLKHTLEIAELLGTERIRIFSFYLPKDKSAADCKNEVIERLGTMCDLARSFGISLCHENEKGIYGDIPERCLEIHRALPELRGVFDPANYVQCGVEPLKAWAMLKHKVLYLHIKDAKFSGAVVPAGLGDGNVKEIVRDFLAGGGEAMTVEPHLKVFAGLSQLERSGEQSEIPEYGYPDGDAAFDAACNALKQLLS